MSNAIYVLVLITRRMKPLTRNSGLAHPVKRLAKSEKYQIGDHSLLVFLSSPDPPVSPDESDCA